MANSPTDHPSRDPVAEDEALRERLLARYGTVAEILRVAGADKDRGVDRLAAELGVDVERLLPVLITLTLESTPRILDRRRRFLGGFDIVVLLGLLGLLALVVRAIVTSL
ncbi:MAG: hypothetical protein PVG07_03070 [Acidobacteriota bacterium]|jgi:hypothetical protein